MAGLEKILRIIVRGGLLLLVLTPLVVFDSLFFPFITGKAFFFRFIVEVVFGAWVVLAVCWPQYRPRRTPLLIAFVGLVAVASLATVFGVNPTQSFWSNFERMEGLVTHLHLLALFIVMSAMLQTAKAWRWAFNSSLGVSVALAGYTALQWLGVFPTHQVGDRLDATLGNPIYLAVYALIHIFIAALLFVQSTTRRARVGYGLLALVNLFVLYQTATRSALLGLLGGAVLAGAIMAVANRHHRAVRQWSLVVLVIAVLAGVGFMLVRDSAWIQSNKVLGRLAKTSLTDGTVQSRFTLWSMSVEALQERPLLGWGPENFGVVFGQYYRPSLWRQEPWFDRSHNIFFDWLVSAGVLGLIAYITLFGVAFYLLWRQHNPFTLSERAIITGLLVAYCFHNLFVFDNLVSYLAFLLVLGYIQWRVFVPAPFATTGALLPPPRLVVPVAIASLVTTIACIWYVVLIPWSVNRLLIEALYESTINERWLSFQKALAYQHPLGRGETIEQFMRFAVQVVTANDAPDELKQAMGAQALEASEAAVAAMPRDPRLLFMSGAFLHRVGLLEPAIARLEAARQLAPEKQSTLHELVGAYLDYGDIERAIALAKATYELDPSYDEARYIYALTLMHGGKMAEGKSLVRPTDNLDGRFVEAYIKAGDFAELIKYWRARIEKIPTDAQLYFNLSASFLAAGAHNQAIAALEQAIQINPQIESQARQLISEIRAGRNPIGR